jgi:hypothetical protein
MSEKCDNESKLEHKTGQYYASLAERDRAEFHKRIEESDLPKISLFLIRVLT